VAQGTEESEAHDAPTHDPDASRPEGTGAKAGAGAGTGAEKTPSPQVKVKVRGVQHRVVQPRTVLTVIVAIVVLAFLWKYRSSLADVVSAISHGTLSAIIVAILFELGRIVFHSFAYTRSFKMIGADIPLRLTVPAWFKAVFMNTVLPSGGTSGLAAVIDTARSRGVAVGSATSAALYTQTCYYSAMFFVIVIGLIVMGATGSLTARDVLLALVIGIAAACFLGLLAFGHLEPGLLQRIMRKIERFIVAACKKLHIKKTPKPWADNLVHSFSNAATRIVSRPKVALTVFGVMVVAMTCDMLAYMASGFAFGITSAPALLGGYVTALVFNSFSPTPGGVGFVEGLSAAVLTGYGYPGTLSLSAVLTYRAFMYWIPFAIGGVMMRVTGAFSSGKKGGEEEQEEEYAREGLGAEKEPRIPLRIRILATLSSKTSLRGVIGTLIVAAAAIVEIVASSMPRDPNVVSVLEAYLPAFTQTLDPAFVISVAYLVLLCCAGLIIQDQGCWILSIVSLVLLGGVSTLAGNGIFAELAVLVALFFLVLWYASYSKHNFLRRIGRLAWVLFYGVVLAVLYAIVCMEVVRDSIACQPTFLQAALLGIQSLVLPPDPAILGDERVIWIARSIRVVANTLLAATVFAIVLMLATNWKKWRSPQAVEMRKFNRVAAREARKRRVADKRAARQERREDRRMRRAETLEDMDDRIRGLGGTRDARGDTQDMRDETQDASNSSLQRDGDAAHEAAQDAQTSPDDAEETRGNTMGKS
jgi:uncharacterized protein (TIRG00374 family)